MNIATQDHFQSIPDTAVYQLPADNDAQLTVTILLHPEADTALEQQEMEIYNTHPKKRRYFDPEEQEKRCATSDIKIQKIVDFVKKAGLNAMSHCQEKREVVISGTLKQFAQLFTISFHLYEDEELGSFLAYHGTIQLPEDIRQDIAHIEGLNEGLQAGKIPSKNLLLMDRLSDTSPAKRFAANRTLAGDGASLGGPQESQEQGYSPQDLAEMYRYPDNLGEGQTIGIIALGGTYKPADLDVFCKTFNLPTPDIEVIGTEPWQAPQSKIVNDIEVNMDVQMAVGMAPKAKIVLYYARTFSEGFQAVLNDHKNKVSVVSTSWANGESYTSASSRQQQITLIRQLSLRGITVLAASGDHGLYQVSANNRVVGINLPAGFPQVIACGGTTLFRNGSEQVWNEMQNASGGSFSVMFPAPAFQYEAIGQFARQYPQYAKQTCATPDLAANASTSQHNIMIVNGKPFMAAGTSAATPIIAGLIARLNTALGYRLGFINNFLYQLMGSSAFNSNIPGSNGLPSMPGWDPCTGLGSPIGVNLLNLIKETEAHWG